MTAQKPAPTPPAEPEPTVDASGHAAAARTAINDDPRLTRTQRLTANESLNYASAAHDFRERQSTEQNEG